MNAPAPSSLNKDHPFPGLRPFDRSDSEFFFGRKDQTYALYRLIDRSRFVAVIGGSGSGKSSLVRAGLLPALESDTRPDNTQRWLIGAMRPGDAPLNGLAEALANLATGDRDATKSIRRERVAFYLHDSSYGIDEALGDIRALKNARVLLVVDQFEELFRYADTGRPQSVAEREKSRNEATRFVQLLLQARHSPVHDFRVLLTMRSDFIGDCARFQGLPEAISASQFLVPSLTQGQREEVICEPIQKAGARIDPTLVNTLLNAGYDDDDQLPILQHCLSRLWESAGADLGATAGRRHLTMRHYEEVRGVGGALSRHADGILDQLKGHESAVERVFRALSEVDKDGRAIRRPLKFFKLQAETNVPDDELRLVLDRFRADDCSFLTPSASVVPHLASDTRIDVGHEALLRRWTRVSGEPNAPSGDDPKSIEARGWLAAEQSDGKEYRDLLGRKDDNMLPLKILGTRLKWWGSRTPIWAERYGGHFQEVGQLFKRSLVRWGAVALGSVVALSIVASGTIYLAYMNAQEAQLKRQNESNYEVVLDTTLEILRTIQGSLRTPLGSVRNDAMPHNTARALLETVEKNVTRAGVKHMTDKSKLDGLAAEVDVVASDIAMAVGEKKKALARARAAKEIAARLMANEKDAKKRGKWRELTYKAAFRIGDAADNPDTTFDEYSKALQLVSELAEEQPDNDQYAIDVLLLTNKLGEGWEGKGNAAQALELFRRSRDAARLLLDKKPQVAELQRKLGEAHTKSGRALSGVNPSDFDALLTEFDAAIAALRPVAETMAAQDRAFPSNLGIALRWKGDVLQRRSDSEKAQPNDRRAAIAYYREAIGIWEPFIEAEPAIVLLRDHIRAAYVGIVDTLWKAGDLPEARTYLKKEIETREVIVQRTPTEAAIRALAARREKLEKLDKLIADQTSPASEPLVPGAMGGPYVPVPQPPAPPPQ